MTLAAGVPVYTQSDKSGSQSAEHASSDDHRCTGEGKLHGSRVWRQAGCVFVGSGLALLLLPTADRGGRRTALHAAVPPHCQLIMCRVCIHVHRGLAHAPPG